MVKIISVAIAVMFLIGCSNENVASVTIHEVEYVVTSKHNGTEITVLYKNERGEIITETAETPFTYMFQQSTGSEVRLKAAAAHIMNIRNVKVSIYTDRSMFLSEVGISEQTDGMFKAEAEIIGVLP